MTPVEAREAADAIRLHAADGFLVPLDELRWLHAYEEQQRVPGPEQQTGVRA